MDTDVYVLNVASGDSRALVVGPGPDGAPTWSPDGEWILLSKFDRDLGSIYYLNRELARIPALGGDIEVLTGEFDEDEAARTLGAPGHRVLIDVLLPALAPAMIAAGAIAFATAMGAFGTAFTLATDIDVLPMTIYTEFTLSANIAMASALSVMLGLVTWGLLLIARSVSGTSIAAGG